MAYKDFLVKVINSDEKMNEIFGPTEATAEKAGDVIEFWLGLLDIASMTKGAVNIFDDDINPTEYLNCLEAAVRFFGKIARTSREPGSHVENEVRGNVLRLPRYLTEDEHTQVQPLLQRHRVRCPNLRT